MSDNPRDAVALANESLHNFFPTPASWGQFEEQLPRRSSSSGSILTSGAVTVEFAHLPCDYADVPWVLPFASSDCASECCNNLIVIDEYWASIKKWG